MSDLQTLETAVGPCFLKRSNRKTLGISVYPNGSVELIAPTDSAIEDILAKVKKRSRWVEKHRREFDEMNAVRTPRKYCSGATHRYLGKQYRLKIGTGLSQDVKLRGGFFHVQIKSRDDSKKTVKTLLEDWTRTQAEKQFSKRLNNWRPWCEQNQLPTPVLYLRSMLKRWGSAHRNGRIYLNPELIRAPSRCVDYVIAHEICHLKQPNHGPQFYRLLDEIFVNWREAKIKLEQAEL